MLIIILQRNYHEGHKRKSFFLVVKIASHDKNKFDCRCGKPAQRDRHGSTTYPHHNPHGSQPRAVRSQRWPLYAITLDGCVTKTRSHPLQGSRVTIPNSYTPALALRLWLNPE